MGGDEERNLYSQDIEDIFKLETDLFPCLVDMRFLGVRVDIETAHQLKDKLTNRRKRIITKK